MAAAKEAKATPGSLLKAGLAPEVKMEEQDPDVEPRVKMEPGVKMEVQDPDVEPRVKMEPGVKMEEQDFAGLGAGLGRERGAGAEEPLLRGAKRRRREEAAGPREPEEGPSGSWDARLQEFLKTLQDPRSGGEEESPQAPSQGPWGGPKAPPAPSQGEAAAAQAHKWPGELWVSPTQPQLLGPEPEAAPAAAAKGKEGTFDRGAAGVEGQRRRFRAYRYGEAGRPWELCKQLRELCRQWLRPETHTKEQMLELVTLEQFLAILPPEMQSWVRSNKPETCAQAVTLAEGFLLQQREAKGWGEQVSGASKEKSVNPPKATQALPDAVKMPLLTEVKQEVDESNNFSGIQGVTGREELGDVDARIRRPVKREAQLQEAGDGWLSESQEEKPFVGNLQPQSTSFQAAREKEFRHQGEADENQQRPERQNGNEDEKGAEPRPGSGAACKEVQESTSQDEEHEEKYDISRESAGHSSQLASHMSPAGQEQPYKCWHCGQSFSSSADLLSHERTHVGEKLYKCSQCGEHKRVHIGQQPHKCSHCGNVLVSSAQEGINPGGKTYVCSDCGKGYTRITEFIKHQRSHRGEKPYSCPSCGEKFGSSSHLQLHQRIHTAENPYQCSHCGKCFRWSSHLAVHERSHEAERDETRPAEESFVCFACGKTFEVSSELVAHLQTHA